MSNKMGINDGRGDHHRSGNNYNTYKRPTYSSSSGEEDIIDGFAISSYSSVTALEARVATDNHQRNRNLRGMKENCLHTRKRRTRKRYKISRSSPDNSNSSVLALKLVDDDGISSVSSGDDKCENEDENLNTISYRDMNKSNKEGRHILKGEFLSETNSNISGKLSVASIIGNSSADSNSLRSKNHGLNREQGEAHTQNDQGLRAIRTPVRRIGDLDSQISGKWCNAHVKIARLILQEKLKEKDRTDNNKDPASSNSIHTIASSRYDGATNLPGYTLQSQVKDSVVPPLGLSVYPGYSFPNAPGAATQNGQVGSSYDMTSGTSSILGTRSIGNYGSSSPYQSPNLPSVVKREEVTSMNNSGPSGGNWGNLSRVHADQVSKRSETKSPSKASHSPDVEAINGSTTGTTAIKNESENENRNTTKKDTLQDDKKSEGDSYVKDHGNDATQAQPINDSVNKELDSKKGDKSSFVKNRGSPLLEHTRPGSNHINQAERNVRNPSPRARSSGSESSRLKASASHIMDSGRADSVPRLSMGHNTGALREINTAERYFAYGPDISSNTNPLMNQLEMNQLYRNMFNQHPLQSPEFAHASNANVPQQSPYIDQRHFNLVTANSSLSQYGIDATTAYYLSQHPSVSGYSGQLGSALNSTNYSVDMRKFEQAGPILFGGLSSGISQSPSAHQNGIPGMIHGMSPRLSAPGMSGGISNKPVGVSSLDQLQLTANSVSTHSQPSYGIRPPSGEDPVNPLNTIPITSSLHPGFRGTKPDSRDDRSTSN
ncbi:uncharacterized protein TRIADDRAFT_59177 [Trichoplax adhaerens]|uniref:Uncharacterized protein n=1 Tax=Trichoplax adhaerens TaxID=10228 RepID=B3S531_TRIAD|nr:hypothetical protein TRIADDRAFT_59177 [Trichoplax adhaerens]EDV22064.1 hypothetical protein TRIADDRAFT_59177 [Trichoplax adhaerens]|eukprot:XP_002115219.1 hypothetical protein TRIADDRAFT_59177 [Trichoplax adhaerens]